MVDVQTLLDREKRILLLPGFLGLDAPVVFVSWLALIAKTVEKFVPLPVFVAAFLAVWAIYLADRLVDVVLCRYWKNATTRLRYGRRYRLFFAVALAISVGFGVALAVTGFLPKMVLLRGIIVAIGVGIYFAIFVAPPFFRRSKFLGKEFGVGLFFAAGIVVAIGFEARALLILIGFAVAATFNCLLIAARDKVADATNDPGAASQWWPMIQRDLRIVGWVFFGVALVFCCKPGEQVAFICLAVSFAAMTLLHTFSARFSGAEVRAYADFCLLTPLIGGWFL